MVVSYQQPWLGHALLPNPDKPERNSKSDPTEKHATSLEPIKTGWAAI
jgi:hypothetical protein